jgi:hypothetical protein
VPAGLRPRVDNPHLTLSSSAVVRGTRPGRGVPTIFQSATAISVPAMPMMRGCRKMEVRMIDRIGCLIASCRLPGVAGENGYAFGSLIETGLLNSE